MNLFSLQSEILMIWLLVGFVAIVSGLILRRSLNFMSILIFGWTIVFTIITVMLVVTFYAMILSKRV